MINGGKCIGDYDGNFLLDTIGNVVFPTVTSDVNILWCFGSTILIALGMKIVYVILIKRRFSFSTTLTRASVLKRSCNESLYAPFFKMLASSLFIIGMFISVLIWISSKEKFYDAHDCIKSLYDLDFRLDNFDGYEKAFNRYSTMTLPQAGIYEGPDGILEYVQFLFSTSAYLSKSEILRTDRHFLGYDKERGICSFRELHFMKGTFDVANTGSDDEVIFTVMTRLEHNPDKQVIESIYVDFEMPFASYFFEELA